MKRTNKLKTLTLGIMLLIILVALTMIGCKKSQKEQNYTQRLEVVKAEDMHEGYLEKLVKQGKYDKNDENGNPKDAIFFMFYLGTVKNVPIIWDAIESFWYDGVSDVTYSFKTSNIKEETVSNTAEDITTEVTSNSNSLGGSIGVSTEHQISLKFFGKGLEAKATETINATYAHTWENSSSHTISNSYTQAATMQQGTSHEMSIHFNPEKNKAGFYRYVKHCWVDVFATLWIDKEDLTERDENGNYNKKYEDLTIYYAKSVSPVRKISWEIEYSENGDFSLEEPKEKLTLNATLAKSVIKARGFDGGRGADTDPYKISNIDQLSYIGAFDKEGQQTYYKLAKDLDAENKDLYIKQFSGVLDGDGYSISNLEYNVNTSNMDKYKFVDDNTYNYYKIGLIGQNDGTIRNLNIENSNITVKNVHVYVGLTNVYVGLLAGESRGTIENCHAKQISSVVAKNSDVYVGGLVGRVFSVHNKQAIISNCTSEGVFIECENNNEMRHSCRVGGLIGGASGKISDSCALGAVKCTSNGFNVYDYIGGLIGEAQGGKISDSCATGDVEYTGQGTQCDIGGLIGYATSQIINSHAMGAVKCTSITSTTTSKGNVGGLVGSTWGITISNSYALGAVTYVNNGDFLSDVGGLIGKAQGGEISNSYALGEVRCTSSSDSGFVGGLIGSAEDEKISNSYALGAVTYTSTGNGNRGSICVGGLIGEDQGKQISNSYALGAVTYTSTGNSSHGRICVGGLIGCAYHGKTTNCVNIGDILIKSDTTNVYCGKSIGSINDAQTQISSVYFNSSATYDVPTTAQECTNTNIVGKTLAEIERVNFFTNTLKFDPTIWNIIDGEMPTLR